MFLLKSLHFQNVLFYGFRVFMLPDFSSLLDTETVYAGVGQGGEHEDKKGTVHKYPLRAPLVKV